MRRSSSTGPAPWLLSALDRFDSGRAAAPPGLALDVACGHGRNLLETARRGRPTVGLDRSTEALAACAAAARSARLPVALAACDLESGSDPIAPGEFSLVLVFRYLWRPLFPRLLAAVRPGGLLIYETFTVEQARYGRPRNPDFLLRPGELRERLAGWIIEDADEGLVELAPDSTHAVSGTVAAMAAIVARRPL